MSLSLHPCVCHTFPLSVPLSLSLLLFVFPVIVCLSPSQFLSNSLSPCPSLPVPLSLSICTCHSPPFLYSCLSVTVPVLLSVSICPCLYSCPILFLSLSQLLCPCCCASVPIPLSLFICPYIHHPTINVQLTQLLEPNSETTWKIKLSKEVFAYFLQKFLLPKFDSGDLPVMAKHMSLCLCSHFLSVCHSPWPPVHVHLTKCVFQFISLSFFSCTCPCPRVPITVLLSPFLIPIHLFLLLCPCTLFPSVCHSPCPCQKWREGLLLSKEGRGAWYN